MQLNPIGKEKSPKEGMRGEGKPSEDSTRKAALGRGMISGPARRISARSFFRKPVFSAFYSSFSKNLVSTQLPTAGVSASAVLAFLAAALVAAPAAVALLLPMARWINLGLTGNGGRDAM
jgi:hypothetical protein